MKIIISVFTLVLSLNAGAESVKFKSIDLARSAGAIHAICFSRSGSPQLTLTFDQNFSGYEASAATLALVKPEEGAFVRNWPGLGITGTSTMAWTISPTQGDMTITGIGSSPWNERLVLFVKDGTNGRFAAKVDYNNYSTGVSVSRDVRCYLTNTMWKL